MATLYFDGDLRRIYEVPTNGAFTIDGNGHRIYSGPGEEDSRITSTYLWSRWVDWHSQNLWAELAFEKSGGAYRYTLDGDDYYATFDLRLINEWVIVPADYKHNFTILGNLFPNENGVDFDTHDILNVQFSSRIFFSDSLQIVKQAGGSADLSEIYTAAFGGKVHISSSGIAGTAFPIGTSKDPVNNIADAKLIAASFGLKEFYLVDDLTLTESLSDIVISGMRSVSINLNGQTLTDVEIDNLTVTGAMAGSIRARKSSVHDVSGISGSLDGCEVYGSISLADSSVLKVSSCSSVNSVSAFHVGTSSVLAMDRFSGATTIEDLSAGATALVGLDHGYVDVAATCVGGGLTLFGVGHLDNSAGPGVTVSAGAFVSDPDAKLRYKMAFVYDGGTWDEV